MHASPPRVLVHPDFLVLEDELVRLVREEAARPRNGFPRILILATTRRQVERVREVLAERCGALAGVEVLTHLALAMRLVEAHGGRSAPRLAGRPLRESVVRHLLKNSGLDLATYADEHVSVPEVLSGVFHELREAGILPRDLESAAEDPRTLEVARLYGWYDEALDRVATSAGREGAKAWTDRAGITRSAAAGGGPEYDLVVQYGTYELVGMNLDLVSSLAPRSPVVFLIPSDPDAPGWSYARAYAARHFPGPSEPVATQSPPRPFVAGARSLRREADRTPDTLPESALTWMHAQGAESELTAAVRIALDRVHGGAACEQVAILARNVQDYAPFAEAVFRRLGVPVDSSIGIPVSLYPRPRVLLGILRAMLLDFPRQRVIDVVRMPSLNRGAEHRRWTPDLWDRWSRAYRIVRGLDSWAGLPELLRRSPFPETASDTPESRESHRKRTEDNAASAELLVGMLQTWGEEHTAWSACGTAAEHLAFLKRLAGRWIRGWIMKDADGDDLDVQNQVGAVLDELESLESGERLAAQVRGSGGGGFRLSPRDVYDYLEAAFREALVPLRRPGGVRFLDLMQARGLVFDHVVLIGFNADVIPRRPRDDVFLPDSVRLNLRRDTGRPLAVRGEGIDEEHLLLAQALASVRVSLTVSWQRADAQGSAKPVSLQLRELARIAAGSPSMGEVLESGVDRVPTHPARNAGWGLEKTGLLTREESVLLAGDLGLPHSREAVSEVLATLDREWFRTLSPHLALVRDVERFAGGDRAFDGNVPGGSGWSRAYSASGLQRLGKCPQQFLFRDVLRVRPLEGAADDLNLDALEVGTTVHELLEKIYTELFLGTSPAGPGQIDLFSAGSSSHADAKAQALEALDRYWPETMGKLGARIRRRFPVLWEAMEGVWRREIGAFLDLDLERLRTGGIRVIGTETPWESRIPVPGPDGDVDLAVMGKVDRVARLPSGRLLVSDYKTGGSLKGWVKAQEFLRGDHVQLPLYTLLAEEHAAGAGAEAELLGLGPGFLPDAGYVRDREPIRFGDEEFPEELRRGFLESLFLLDALNREGRFPMNPARHCNYCDFKPACRRFHIPSKIRGRSHPDHQDYFRMRLKGKKTPMLADVPLESEDEE